MEASTNLGRVSPVPRGEYKSTVSYERLDIVEYNGSSYIVLKNVKGITPSDGDNYMLMAAKGDIGPQGIQGPKGVCTTVDASGMWAFSINGDGHLLVSYAGNDAPDLSIGENGHLYLNLP